MRALLKDVSIDELKQLREEGYSNREIADCLDVSEVTVYRYIGKMPKELKARRYSEAAKERECKRREKATHKAARQTMMPEGQTVTDGREIAPQTQQSAVLSVQVRTIELEGTVGHYAIRAGVNGKRMVTISTAEDADSAITINFDDLSDFAAEIMRILQHRDAFTGGLEAW